MTQVVADLLVKVGGDASGAKSELNGASQAVNKFQSDTNKALSAVEGAFSKIGTAAHAAISPLTSVTGAVTGLFGKLTNGLATIGFAAYGLERLGQAVTGLGGAILGGNATMENYITSFGVLLGSVDAAKQRMAELANFAAKTPFTLPEVAEASRTLQALTNGALATGKGLQMIGNAASGVQQPFADIADLLGRVYVGLENGGVGIGQETQRLSELGIITGNTRVKIQQLIQTHGDMSKAWQMVEGDLSRFNGMMDAQSKTFTGLTSNLSDNFHMLLRTFAQPIFDIAKSGLTDLVNWSQDTSTMVAVQHLADGLKTELGSALDFVHNLVTDLSPAFSDFFSMLSGGDGVLNALSTAAGDLAGGLASLFGLGADQATQFAQVIGNVVGNALDRFAAIWNGLLVPAFQWAAGFIGGTLLPAFLQLSNWLTGFMPIAVGIAAQVFNGLFVPVIQTVANIVITYLIPAFEQIATWLGANLPPIIAGISSVWTTMLAPALTFIAGVITQYLIPAILAIASFLVQNWQVALIAVGAVIGAVAIPAIVAFVAALSPIEIVVGAVVVAITLLKAAWDNNFLGMRDILTAVGNAIGSTLGWIGDRIHDFLSWLGINMPQAAADTSNGFMTNLNGGLVNGMPTLNTNISGIGGNLAALQNPAAAYGANIGNNWIKNICENVAAGIPVLNSQIQAIRTAMNTMSEIATGQSVPGYGFGPSVGLDSNGNPIGPAGSPDVMTPEQTRQYYVNKMQTDLAKQMDIAKAQLKQMQDAAGGLVNGQVIGPDINLFSGTSFTGGSNNGNIPFTPNGNVPGGGGGGKGGAGGSGSKISALQAAADQAKQFADLAKSTLDGIASVMKIQIPAGFNDQLDKLAQVLNMAVLKLQTVALNFGAKGLNATSLFADAAQKVFGALNTAFDFFSKIADTGNKVLFGATSLAATTVALETKIVIVMNTLGAMIPGWDTFATEQIGGFADATGKVFSALSIAFDFFTKLAATGDAVLNGTAKLASLAVQLSEKVVIVMNVLGSMIPLWDTFADDKISAFADATGKVFTGLSTAFDFFSKLSTTGQEVLNGAAKLASLAAQLSEKIVITMNVLGAMIPLWDDLSDTKIGNFADATAKVVDALGKSLTFFGQLATSTVDVSIVADKVTSLSYAIRQMMDTLGPLTEGWEKFQDQVAAFATASGNVADGLSKSISFFGDLAGSKVSFAPLADRVTELANAVRQVMDVFGPLSTGWDAFNAQVTAFAGTVGSVVDALSKAISLFGSLASEDFKVPPKSAVDALFNSLNDVLVEFHTRSAAWEADFDDESAVLAGRIGAILDNVTKALSLISALASEDFKVGPKSAVVAFFNGLSDVLNEFKQRSAEFTSLATEDVVALSTAIGTVMDGISKAISPLIALQGIKPISSGQIDVFFTDLDLFLNAFAAKAIAWQSRAFDKIAPIAVAVGSIAEALGKVVDPLLKIMGFKPDDGKTAGTKPTLTLDKSGAIILQGATGGVDGFFNALDSFLTKFAQRALAWKDKASVEVQKIATGIGTVMDGIGKAVDPIVKLETFKGVDSKTLDSFFGTFSEFLNRIKSLIDSLPPDFASTAAQFGASIADLFSNLKTATDTASNIKVPADLPDIFGKILTALQGLVDYMQKTAVTVWSNGLKSIVTDAQNAATAITKAIQSIPPWPIPPNGGNNSGNNNGNNENKQPGPPGYRGPKPFTAGGFNPTTFTQSAAFIPPVGAGSSYRDCIFIDGQVLIQDAELAKMMKEQLKRTTSRQLGQKVGTVGAGS